MSFKTVFVITFFLGFAGKTYTQGFLKADGKSLRDAAGKEVILRGIGLGGWMLQEPYMLQLSGAAGTQHEIKNKITALIGKEKTETFYNAWRANHYTKTDIDSLAAWGFNSVRLPMHYNLFTLPIEEEPVGNQNTWLSKGFALTDSLLKWCTANKIYLILDLHAAPGGEGTDAAISDYDTTKPSLWQSEANRQKTVALWRKLAQRYANEKWIGGYDLVNEPNWGFENAKDQHGCAEMMNAPLRKLYVDLTAAIREVDQNHLIIIEGNCWGNNYKGIFPFSFANTAVSFHKYWNYNDEQSIQAMINVRETYNMPVWVGESGENGNTWTTNAIKLLEDHNIGWCWWPLKKMGFNCPFEVIKSAKYQAIVNYWRGKGEKPEPTQAFETLMQLAKSLQTKNTVHHKDFTDAMFRQVATTATKPYDKNLITKNNIVFATDFDLGRNGYAYHDNDTANYRVSTNKNIEWNKGHTYRNDGVDIEAGCADSVTNGNDVFSIEPGEWLQYTVAVAKPGTYDIALRTSPTDSAGTITLTVNDIEVAKNLDLKTGANNKDWQTNTIKNVGLKNFNKIRLYVLKGGFKLNYLQFIKR